MNLWFTAYRKKTQPSIFTVGSQQSFVGSLAPGTTNNWFSSQKSNELTGALLSKVNDFTSISARGVRFSVRFRIYQMVHTSSLNRWPNEANAGERQGFAEKSRVALSHRPGVAQFHHSASP